MNMNSKGLAIWFAAGIVVATNCFSQTPPSSATIADAGKPSVTTEGQSLPGKANVKPVLARFGGMDANPMRFETGNAEFRFPLRIESTGQAEATDVTLAVHSLWGPDGTPFEITCRIVDKPCASETIRLASGQALEAIMSVKLGGVGTYSAWVTLSHAGRLESRLVEIKRLIRPATFNVTGGEQASDGTLWVTIVDTAAEGNKLSRPEVLALTRSQKNKPSTQAKFKTLEVLDDSGKVVAEPIDLAASQSRRLTFRFINLEPGEYVGKLQFTALNGSQSKEFEIKQLTTRWAWYWALIPILIGAVVSHLLREWATRYRPLLVKRQSIVALVANLDDAVHPLLPLDDAEVRVEASVRKQLDMIERMLDAEAMSVIDSTLEALKPKVEVLPFWVSARRRVATLEPPSLRAGFQDTLVAGDNFLTNPRSEASDPSIEALRKLDSTITAAVRDELRRQVTQLHEQVDKQIASTNRIQHRNRLLDLVPQIKELESAVASDEKAARDLLENVRSKFALALISDFRQSLDEGAPATVELTDWTILRDMLSAELDRLAADANAQSLVEAYRAALRTYVATLTTLLLKSVGKRILIVEASRIGDADKSRFLSDLQSINGALNLIRQDVRDSEKLVKASEDLWEIMTRLSDLAGEYQRIAQAPLGAPEVAGAVGKVTRGASVPEGLSDDARQEVRAHPSNTEARSRADGFGDWIRTGDAAVTLAAGVIALVLGIKAVWADNPGWGGFDDWLVALLWGLGLHQGASGVFEGIAGLKRKFA